MWRIKEHRNIEKICRNLSPAVVKKYELWKNIIPGKSVKISVSDS
jgi:hypothetical protein